MPIMCACKYTYMYVYRYTYCTCTLLVIHYTCSMEYYVMDLNMLDNFNQTLTNCQVQIKTEVSANVHVRV